MLTSSTLRLLAEREVVRAYIQAIADECQARWATTNWVFGIAQRLVGPLKIPKVKPSNG